MPDRILNIRFLLATLLLLGLLTTARAQWLTQTNSLKAGWNAVFLHVDASHDTIDSLVGAAPGNPIEEIWRWNPPGTVQFIEDPQLPSDAASEWSRWVAGGGNLGLSRLVGDSAYLVRVATNGAPYNWTVTGRPVPPRRAWTVTGLNFIGFPTVPNTPPKFDAFLAQAPELQSADPEIYHYPGGDLGPGNPVRLASFFYRNTPVKRGQAFWVRSGEVFNRYFGPFEVLVSGPAGAEFGDRLSAYSLRLRNLTAGPLTVSLRLAPSDTAPAGHPPVVAVPPLLVRGSLSLSNLTYGFTNLPVGSPRSWTLAGRDQEGSEVEVVLGLARSLMGGSVGDLLGGILQFTDSLGHTRVDVPVSATVSSSAGLWVGGAAITQVAQYLKSYARVVNDDLVISNNQYVVSGILTNLAAVPAVFPLRLIVHSPTNGAARLLQRVYYGLDASTNPVVANGEAALHPALLDQARRISAAHLPWEEANPGWSFNGLLAPGAGLLTASVTNQYNDRASNPFLHAYHPDHDNLDARFNHELAQGVESYTVIRDISLRVTAPADDFGSRTAGGLTLAGDYLETIRMLGLDRGGGVNDARQFEVRGVFTLNRISDLPTLSIVP